MKKYYIYCHRNPFNGKIYIGQTCQEPEKRWRGGNGYKNNKTFYRDIQLIGWKRFQHIILLVVYSQQKADEAEKYYIKLFGSTNPRKGYNFYSGRTQKKRSKRG